MKKIFTLWAMTLVLGQAGGCAKDTQITLKINPDNTAQLSVAMTYDRAALLQEADTPDSPVVRDDSASEEKWDEGSEPVNPPKPPVADTPPAAPATDDKATDQQKADERIRKFLRENMLRNKPGDNAHVKQTIGNIEITPDIVKMSVSWAFDDWKTCIAELPVLMQSDVRFQLEKTDQGKLALTVKPRDLPPDKSQLVAGIMQSGGSGKLTVIMPGEIIESSLPGTDANATTIAYESTDEKSVVVLADTLMKPVRIVCEPGDMDLAALPLDSDELESAVEATEASDESNDPAAKLPIVDATMPFVAEAMSVTSHLVHDYPDSAQFAHQLQSADYGQRNQCEVHARLFPAPQQRIMSITSVQVTGAKDDRGRAIKAMDNHVTYSSSFDFDASDADEPDSDPAAFQITLQLPADDARSIETLEGRLIATTFDAWKIQRLEQIKPAPQNPMDLKDALPGAAITIRRVRSPRLDANTPNRTEGVVQLRVTGPDEIRGLQITVQVPGYSNISTYLLDDSTTNKDGHAVREMGLRYSLRIDEDARFPTVPKPMLIVRYPAGLKRLRIPFTLKAMDLY